MTNFKKVYFMFLTMFTIVLGCSTPTDGVTGKERETEAIIEVLPQVEDSYELCWRNQFFEYKVKDGKRTFERLSDNATLRDLANFAMNDCYNGYLARKIKGYEPLTEEDGVLLSFILNAQLTVIDTFSVALLGDMTSQGYLHDFIVQCKDRSEAFSRDFRNPDILRQQSDAFTQLKMNFINASGGLRVPMRTWGTEFKKIPDGTISKVFCEINKESRSADNSNKSYLRSHPWIWSMTLLGGGLGGVVALTSSAPDQPNDFEKECDKYNRDSVKGKENWQVMQRALSVYTQELDRLINDMGKYVKSDHVKNSESRRIVEDALSSTGNDYQGVKKYLDYAIYDLPFCLLTYKARARMKDCQGYFNDDEEKMKEVWIDYAHSVSDKEMLRNIRTWYSASCYSRLVELLKDELWSNEFREFCQQTRLYKINNINEGKGQNDITPYNDK